MLLYFLEAICVDLSQERWHNYLMQIKTRLWGKDIQLRSHFTAMFCPLDNQMECTSIRHSLVCVYPNIRSILLDFASSTRCLYFNYRSSKHIGEFITSRHTALEMPSQFWEQRHIISRCSASLCHGPIPYATDRPPNHRSDLLLFSKLQLHKHTWNKHEFWTSSSPDIIVN